MLKRWNASRASTRRKDDDGLPPHPPATPAADGTPVRTEPGLFSFLAAWSERRFAAQCCRELLQLHSTISAHHANLAGVDLYRMIVTAHVGGDAAAADHVLHRAQESYALWPVPRALTFRDVAHYLAVSGYWALHRGRRWTSPDIRRFIDASIPSHL